MLDAITKKIVIYQRLLQSIDLLNWYTSRYSASSLQPYIYESSQSLPSKDIKYPSIRYKLLPPMHPIASCDLCTEEMIFDIYIESRKENTNESDELIDIVRNLFFENCGRGTGIFTETNEQYILLTGGQRQVHTWDAEVIFQDQFGGDPNEGRINASGLANIHTDGQYFFNVLRFKIAIAED
jgi:hypothetical protein